MVHISDIVSYEQWTLYFNEWLFVDSKSYHSHQKLSCLNFEWKFLILNTQTTVAVTWLDEEWLLTSSSTFPLSSAREVLNLFSWSAWNCNVSRWEETGWCADNFLPSSYTYRYRVVRALSFQIRNRSVIVISDAWSIKRPGTKNFPAPVYADKQPNLMLDCVDVRHELACFGGFRQEGSFESNYLHLKLPIPLHQRSAVLLHSLRGSRSLLGEPAIKYQTNPLILRVNNYSNAL